MTPTLLTPVAYSWELSQELMNILSFWQQHSLDLQHGGFIGQLTDEGVVDWDAPKGSVLNARILWTFSAGYRYTGRDEYRVLAHRANAYFRQYFLDSTYGGVFWSVDSEGKPLNTRKQIYSLAFAIYGLSEYYKIEPGPETLQTCIELYQWIEQYSFDAQQGGYFEAFSRDGSWLSDMRLSEKDRNDPKTMNTHLHILEGYTNLYHIWPDASLRTSIHALLNNFKSHIINFATGQQRLFFTADWQPTSPLVSFGHDIEAAWLLLKAAEVLGDITLIDEFRQLSVQIARVTAQKLQPDGSLFHEFDPETGHYDTHREWWVSAEAMIGFLNAYQLTGESQFYEQSIRSWKFIEQHILDQTSGEWHWGIWGDYSLMTGEDKIGFWKCPYHNTRACIEVLERLQKIS